MFHCQQKEREVSFFCLFVRNQKNELLFGGQSLEADMWSFSLCMLCDLNHFRLHTAVFSSREGHGGRRVRKITLLPGGSEYFPGCSNMLL